MSVYNGAGHGDERSKVHPPLIGHIKNSSIECKMFGRRPVVVYRSYSYMVMSMVSHYFDACTSTPSFKKEQRLEEPRPCSWVAPRKVKSMVHENVKSTDFREFFVCSFRLCASWNQRQSLWSGRVATKGIGTVDAMPTSIITTVTTVIQPDGTVEQSTETETTTAGRGGGRKRQPNRDLVARLREHGQEHALAFWDDLTDAQQTALESDVSALAFKQHIVGV